MIKYFFTALIIIVSLIMVFGCSDRGTNIPVKPESDYIRTPQDVRISPGVHDFFPELSFQIRNEFRLLEMALYVPQVSFPKDFGGEFKSVPMLILLPPQDGDQYYYFNHGLQQIADDLIADGTIEPMIICCITNDKAFGGYFYASSDPAGDYDAIIGDKLISGFIEANYPTLKTQAKRGIGGIGMGAYGAFRAAIKHPNAFSSISVTDGPLDFDGLDNKSGLMDLFDDALAEQGLDASSFKDFDSSGTWHISRLFIGGAIAFSPHDTLIYWHTENISSPAGPVLQVIADSTEIIDDSTTLITDVVAGPRNFDFHLPFDGNGNAYQLIWNMWLDNNLEKLLDDAGTDALGSIEIQVNTTPDVRYGFYDQTQSWLWTIENPPYSYKVDVNEYTGYNGNPATHDQYLYEVMRDMLIFHNDNFYGE